MGRRLPAHSEGPFIFRRVCFVLLTAGALAAAPEKVTLTWEDAQRMSLAGHPKLKVALAQVKQAREQVEIAASPGRTQVNLLASRTAIQTTQGPPFETTIFGIPQRFQAEPVNYQLSRAALEVRQLVYDGGELAAQLHGLRASTEQSYQNLVFTAYQLNLDTRLAYLEVIDARLRREAAFVAVGVAERAVKLAEARYAAGSAAEADIVFARADLSRARLTHQEGQRRVEQAVASLNRLIGLPQDTPLELTEPPAVAAPPPLAEGLSMAMQARPDLRALERAREAAQHTLEFYRRSGGPRAFVVGSAEGVGYNQDLLLTSPGWRVGMELNWPLWQGGLVEHQEAQAGARVEESEARLADARQELELQVRKAYTDWEVARAGLVLAEDQRAQTEKALQMALGQYEVGYGTILQVSQAQSNAQTSEAQLTASRYDVLRALARLEFVIGKEPPAWQAASASYPEPK